jgi:hypothetical protein
MTDRDSVARLAAKRAPPVITNAPPLPAIDLA